MKTKILFMFVLGIVLLVVGRILSIFSNGPLSGNTVSILFSVGLFLYFSLFFFVLVFAAMRRTLPNNIKSGWIVIFIIVLYFAIGFFFAPIVYGGVEPVSFWVQIYDKWGIKRVLGLLSVWPIPGFFIGD